MKILVDTNVIIDILCKREPFFEDSYNALNKCIDNHTIIVSASAITDISQTYSILQENILEVNRQKNV